MFCHSCTIYTSYAEALARCQKDRDAIIRQRDELINDLACLRAELDRGKKCGDAPKCPPPCPPKRKVDVCGNFIPQFVPIQGEHKRVYTFPGNESVVVPSVTGLCVRPSGSHRLETAGGCKVCIPAGWLSLEIYASHWSC
jgi:hypothetical protein